LGPNKNFLMGDQSRSPIISALGLLTAGEIVHCDLSPWPNVTRWLKTMQALPNWGKVHEKF